MFYYRSQTLVSEGRMALGQSSGLVLSWSQWCEISLQRPERDHEPNRHKHYVLFFMQCTADAQLSVSVFWPKHHWKSVDRPQESSVCQLVQKSNRTRRFLWGWMGKNPETRPDTLLAAKKLFKICVTDQRVTTMQSWRSLLQLFGMEISSKGELWMIWLRRGRVCRYKLTTTVLVDKRHRKADDRKRCS